MTKLCVKRGHKKQTPKPDWGEMAFIKNTLLLKRIE